MLKSSAMYNLISHTFVSKHYHINIDVVQKNVVEKPDKLKIALELKSEKLHQRKLIEFECLIFIHLFWFPSAHTCKPFVFEINIENSIRNHPNRWESIKIA